MPASDLVATCHLRALGGRCGGHRPSFHHGAHDAPLSIDADDSRARADVSAYRGRSAFLPPSVSNARTKHGSLGSKAARIAFASVIGLVGFRLFGGIRRSEIRQRSGQRSRRFSSGCRRVHARARHHEGGIYGLVSLLLARSAGLASDGT